MRILHIISVLWNRSQNICRKIVFLSNPVRIWNTLQPTDRCFLNMLFKDTIIFERLDPSCQELMETTTEHLSVGGNIEKRAQIILYTFCLELYSKFIMYIYPRHLPRVVFVRWFSLRKILPKNISKTGWNDTTKPGIMFSVVTFRVWCCKCTKFLLLAVWTLFCVARSKSAHSGAIFLSYITGFEESSTVVSS